MVATSTDQIRLQLRSWPEVETYLERCKGVIVPLGSTEQHGPTGAIGTDALTAEAVALEVGRRTGVLVAPAQAYGMAEHHLGFAGTMSLQPATLLALMHDLVLSLARHGFERIYVINGHGGNIATTKAAFAQAYGTAAARGLANASALPLEPSLQRKQKPLPEAAPAGPIHGPDDFRRRHPDGRMGSDPSLATADHGAQFLEVAAASLSSDLQRFLEEPAS